MENTKETDLFPIMVQTQLKEMTMTRLSPVNPDTAEGQAKELLSAVKQAMGSTPNIFTTFANAPAALEGYLNFNQALSKGALNPKLREKIALVTAGANGCDYCASAHTFLGDKDRKSVV